MSGSKSYSPIQCDIDFDTSNIVGKTAIVTGGANGLGEAYVRALHAARATVFFGDVNQQDGEKLASELPGTTFIPCNVTNWSDQLHLFQAAESQTGAIHFVIANAGIAADDDVFSFEGADVIPTEPKLPVIDINIRGVLYTVKLALHYFIKLNGQIQSPSQVDTCLVLIGSGAAFLDCPRGPQYSASKWGMRGIMHSLYVRTKILTEASFEHVEKSGVEMASLEDAGQALLRLLSDTGINGRSLFISGRKWAPRGYLDLDIDEYSGNKLVQEIQADQLLSAPVELGLFLEKGSKYTMQR
ncbi:hypothetical protein B0J11DRAFT_606113 [Dendryphion nanum]|uniref:Uncharacterized protein n=1 Tax=Dendryphion nanum TaxID=256645 RepID=A0A9P9DS16_9PLEO|nr:hypothetical protein B0J11DRAFT_606113 [Dendryphion nanum]